MKINFLKKKELVYLFVIVILFFAAALPRAKAANCPSSVAGNYTLSVSCVIPSSGFMIMTSGNLTIGAGVTLTMSANSQLIFVSGYSVFPNSGSIAVSSGAVINKRVSAGVVVNNYASGSSCNTLCSGQGRTCISTGQDSNASDSYYWGASGGSCTSGACALAVGDCNTVMSLQCTGNDAYSQPYRTQCCGISTNWTRCFCANP